jgi:hypothetical protein
MIGTRGVLRDPGNAIPQNPRTLNRARIFSLSRAAIEGHIQSSAVAIARKSRPPCAALDGEHLYRRRAST